VVLLSFTLAAPLDVGAERAQLIRDMFSPQRVVGFFGSLQRARRPHLVVQLDDPKTLSPSNGR
jgi:hypothetical protein